MTGDLDAVLASIDGALADDELPDAMRWSPEPERVEDAGAPYAEDRGFPVIPTRRGGVRFTVPEGWTPPRGLAPSVVIVDDPIVWRPLSLPEATRLALQAERSREEYERNLQALRELFAPAAEQLGRLVESLRQIAAESGLRFAELVDAIGKLGANPHAPIPPPRRLRDEDPRAYALALRQSRWTGPDRQVQHRPRPRRVP